MRIYLSYIFTGLITFWLVLFLLGVSAGFANYAPVSALIGAILLFVAAAPVWVLQKRLGLIIGIISCLLILPFDIGFTTNLLVDGFFNWVTVLGFIPIVLVSLSLFFTIKGFKPSRQAFRNLKLKILLCSIPLLLFILYVILYGRYWNWQILKL